MIYIKKLLIAILLYNGVSIQAQDNEVKRKQDFPISISVSSHSWAFPFTNVFRMKPFYPGTSVGTELYYKKGEKGKLFQTAEIGGFLNNASGSALYFNSSFSFRYTTKFGLTSDVGLGLGYFHSFHISDTYKQNSEGGYDKISDPGVPSLSGNITLGLGYDLSKTTGKNIMPFVRYQWIASTSYLSVIGIRPNGLFQLGFQTHIFNR